MYSCDLDEKIFQTLPGQGWQALIEWNIEPVDLEAGHPGVTLEPVIAWVTAKIQRENKRNGHKYEDVIIAPLVRDAVAGADLVLLDRRLSAPIMKSVVYLAPGEALSSRHFELLRGGYAKEAKIQ